MNVLDPDLLKSYRLPGLCECCGKVCKMRCGHHVFSKGAGQVDHQWNLVKVAMSPQDGCTCHHDHHLKGKPSRAEMLQIVSNREGVPVDVIDSVIPAVIACPRWNTLEMSAGWLNAHFPIEVASKAIEIIRRNYEESP